MNDSVFRAIMASLLRSEGGNRIAIPDYQRVFRALLAAVFNTEIQQDRHYLGERLLISRENLENRNPASERGACLGLFRQVAQQDGLLAIGEDKFRLIGYEVPNQGNFGRRRADLLAVNDEGGLVLFECKLAGNSYGPFAAVLEGLDYLAAMLCPQNYEQMQWELEQPFENLDELPTWTQLNRNAVQEVIVLATEPYFERSEGGRIQDVGWEVLSNCLIESTPKVRVRFAKGPSTNKLPNCYRRKCGGSSTIHGCTKHILSMDWN